jgi:hypothetical protein
VSTCYARNVVFKSTVMFWQRCQTQRLYAAHLTWACIKSVLHRNKITLIIIMMMMSRDSSVLKAAGYEQGFDSLQGQEGFMHSTMSRPPLAPSQPSSVHWVLGVFRWRQSVCGVKLTPHLYLLSKLRMVEPYLHSFIHLHGVVLN